MLRNLTLNLAARYRIVGVEVVGLGAFLLLIMFLQLMESKWSSGVEQFSWVFAVIGATGILVGLEILSLNSYLTAK